MTEKTLTTENIKPALDALRGELAPWPVVAMKQDRLNDTQKSAVNSGITSGLVAQIIANTAAIRALESAITGTGLRPLVVASLPAIGTQGILYIVPVTTYDPTTDADVVNYSNEYIWIVAPDAPVTEGYYEQVGQTGIVINNGQLTITVNGVSVGTFTANQSGDTTAAITVPTNADYVDKTTAQTVAGAKTWTDTQSFKDSAYTQGVAVTDRKQNIWKVTDSTDTAFGTWEAIQYTNNKQGFRLNTTNKYKNGDLDPTGNAVTVYFEFLQRPADGASILKWTNGFIDNSVYPLVTNTYTFGNSVYQWSAVYAQTYYYNGTAWGLDQNNTWTGANTFKSQNTNLALQSTVSELGSLTAASNWFRWIDKNGAQNAYISRDVWSDGADSLRIAIVGKRASGAPSTSGTEVDCGIRLNLEANETKSVTPFDNNISLGTSSYQWSSVYAQTYYYNGTQWGLDKVNTWTGANIFSGNVLTNLVEASPGSTGILLRATDQTWENGARVFLYSNTHTGQTNGSIYVDVDHGDGNNTKTGLLLLPNVLYPAGGGINGVSLGNSNNKWKTLNGINPGALGMPNPSGVVMVEIPSSWVWDGTTENSYIAPITGWIGIGSSAATNVRLFNNNSKIGMTQSNATDTDMRAYIPMIAGDEIKISGITSSNFILRIYPCLGNV